MSDSYKKLLRSYYPIARPPASHILCRGGIATEKELISISVAMRHNIAMQQISSDDMEKKVLVLQGGGALGSYQAGAYEALMKAGQEPKWIAGISIGSINAAIIAGNTPENRVPKLRAFWEKVSSGLQGYSFFPGAQARTVFNEASSMISTIFGVPGFYTPRLVSPLLSWPGSGGALSFYDTAPLRETLVQLVDFDLLNNGDIRLSIGAVNVRSGNFKYFDTATEKLGVDHIMASGALPPGFPPVLIKGEYYWDGGLVSNTPLNHVIDNANRQDNLCIFQVDLFSSRGQLPTTLMEAAEREKEIRFSSRTRMSTASAEAEVRLRNAAQNLLKKLPHELLDDPDAKILMENARSSSITVMHLINRPKDTDTQSKDYEFSRLTMEEHWQAGRNDVIKSIESQAWKHRKIPANGMVTFDHGRKTKNEFI
jgi:NTE family protein